MFRGRYVHTMDTKGRVSIPSSFRNELQLRSQEAPILTLSSSCLRLFPYGDWRDYEEKIIDINAFDTNAESLRRFEISNAVDGKIDSQGRLQVPPYMRDNTHMGRDIVIAGVGRFVELWDKALFEAEIARVQAHYAEIRQNVASLETKGD